MRCTAQTRDTPSGDPLVLAPGAFDLVGVYRPPGVERSKFSLKAETADFKSWGPGPGSLCRRRVVTAAGMLGGTLLCKCLEFVQGAA